MTWFDSFMQLMQENQFLQGGAITAVGVAAWQWIKSFWPKIQNAFTKRFRFEVTIDTTKETKPFMYEAMRKWALAHIPTQIRNIRVYTDYDGTGPYHEQTADYAWVWRRGLPVRITKHRIEVEHASSLQDRYEDKYVIHAWFSKKNALDIIQEAHAAHLEEEQKAVGIKVHNCASSFYGDFPMRKTTIFKTFKQLYFDEKDALIQDLDKFLKAKEHYIDLGLLPKRGYLLTGPPGTGKSSIALAIAHHIGWGVFSIPLADVESDSALISIMYNIPDQAVILFEDVDVFFKKRTTATPRGPSFAAFLNCIDGIHAPSNAIIIMTTNHPEKLDWALLRKGRLDYHVNVDYPSIENIEEFLSAFYQKPVSLENLDKKDKLTLADVQELCLSLPDLDSVIHKMSYDEHS